MKAIQYWVIPGVKRKHRELFIWEIMKEVSEWENVTMDEIKERPERRFARLRFVVVYLAGKYGTLTEDRVAGYFGYSHTQSVKKGKRWVKDRLAWDGELRDMVEWVEMRLMGWEKKDVAFKSRRSGKV